jgi:hypothetical protein
MITCASVASSAEEQTSSVNTQVVIQQHATAADSAADGTPTANGAVTLPADALAALEQMAQQHPELKTALEAAKAAVAQTTTAINTKQTGTVTLPPEFQAQWDAVLKKHPELKDALRAGGRNTPQSGSSSTSHSTVIINGKVVYSGPASSASATSSNQDGKEHQRVVVDGKVVEDF